MQGCVSERLLRATGVLCRPLGDCEGWQRACSVAPVLGGEKLCSVTSAASHKPEEDSLEVLHPLE